MLIQRFEGMLTDAGFHRIDFSIPQMKMFYRIYDTHRVYIFHVCDAREGMFFNSSSYENILGQVRQQFIDRGCDNIDILTILYTRDLKSARAVAEREQGVWIVDTLCNRLMIYENQPMDFLQIREHLERLLRDLPVEKPPKKRIQYFSLCNTLIVVINVLVYILMEYFGSTQNALYMLTHGAMYAPYMVNNGEMYRLFTAMWLHFGAEHLLGNMLPLLLLGDNLERAVGKGRYIAIYLIGGLGASMCSFIYNFITASYAVAAGASGAIFAVIGALFCVVARNHGRLEDMTIGRLGVLIVYILYTGITTPGIDNAAHIGGLVIGILLAMVLGREKESVVTNER